MTQPSLLPATPKIAFVVYGTPIPQGSKTGYVVKGRARIVDANSAKLKPWRERVTSHARDAARYHDTLRGPIIVRLLFTFERPASHYTSKGAVAIRAPMMPTGHQLGDNDKLERAIFDSLTDAGVWADDCLVVDNRARKVYAGEHELALDRAGVRIQIQEAT